MYVCMLSAYLFMRCAVLLNLKELLESCFIEFNSIEITATQMHSQLGNAEALVRPNPLTLPLEVACLTSGSFFPWLVAGEAAPEYLGE